MPIACGHCGAAHDTVDEVRTCAGPNPGSHDDRLFTDDDLADAAQAWDDDGTAELPAVAGGVRAVALLGRSVVVPRGAATPAGWEACDRVTVTALDDDGVLDRLESAWRDRTPLVIELAPGLGLDDPDEAPHERVDAPTWELGPWFALRGERWHHAVWANAADGRGPTPVWRWASRAVARGAAPGADTDVVLPDGTPAWCDGGPVGPRPGLTVVHRDGVEHGSLRPYGHGAPAAELAPDQLAAVSEPRGAARVIAPAGSGKTRVLTERARHLLREWQLPPAAVCLVAFNVRAAAELRERTPDVPLHVRTLNSLGLAILDGSPPFGTGRRGLQVLDDRDVRRLIDGLVELPRRANTDPAAAWIESLSAVRLGLRPPTEVEAEMGGDVDGLAEVLPRYRAELARRGAVDFDEQIIGAVELLLRDPAARARARSACRQLLVDEFQDLTPAHLLLIRLLAGPAGAVFGVGDDDQTIYGYAGASPQWLIDFRRAFPTAAEVGLEVNYRCPPAVVTGAANLLTRNRRRVAKVIRPNPGRAANDGELRVVAGADDPVGATVTAVRRHLDEGAAPTDIAVLARVHVALAPVQVALRHAGVPVDRAVDEAFVQRSGIKAALAWLRVGTAAANGQPFRSDDLASAARRPPRGVSHRLLEWVGEQRDVGGLRRLASRLSRERDAAKVEDLAIDVERVAAVAGTSTTADVLRLVRDGIGLGEAAAALDGARRRLDRSAHGDDLEALLALADLEPDPSRFERWLLDALSVPPDPEGVRLATIHAVKGREWPHVVVHHVTAGLLPHRLVDDAEEERRVFHVAVTRARRTATVVTGSPPSPFVAELAEPGAPPPIVVTPPPNRLVSAPARPPVDAGLLNALKAWRTTTARAIGKPAYTVFHDSTLEAIAAARPTSLVALSRVKGLGPTKLERWGDELLAVVGDAG